MTGEAFIANSLTFDNLWITETNLFSSNKSDYSLLATATKQSGKSSCPYSYGILPEVSYEN